MAIVIALDCKFITFFDILNLSVKFAMTGVCTTFMKPYRKPFFGDPKFPFEIDYRTMKQQENELPDHIHDRYELVYIHSGKGIFFINHTWYEKAAGDLFIVPGNTIHHATPDAEKPYVSSAVFFAPAWIHSDSFDDSYSHLLCYELAKQQNSYKITLPDRLQDLMIESLQEIQAEMNEKRIGYHDAVKLLFSRLLLELNRYLHATGRIAPKSMRIAPAWMMDAITRIDKHPELDLGLATLATQANVSAAHFSRLFKKLTSMNITNYVNAKRVIKAKELLLYTDDNIQCIAETCGFETATHFYRVFKGLTGVTPKSYRQRGS